LIDPKRVEELFECCWGLTPPEWEEILKSEDLEVIERVQVLLKLAEVPPDQPASDVAPGERRGDYEIGTLLDEGGMGKVYLARKAGSGDQWDLVVKLIQRVGYSDDEKNFFASEIEALAQLSHDGIARFVDGGIHEGEQYLVMERIVGDSIADYCETKDLDTEAVIWLFLQVCDAVQFAHLHAIQHRDLHARNVIVTPQGTVKVIDFGIAKLTDPNATATASSRPFTFPYASPEHVTGEKTDSRTDVYALGALLYRLLTRRDILPRPTIDTSRNQKKMICDIEPLLASETVDPHQSRQLKGDLDNILRRAIQKDRVDRFRGVQDFRDDLMLYLEGDPVTSTAQTPLYRAQKYIVKHWVAIATLSVSLMFAIWRAHIAATEYARTHGPAKTPVSGLAMEYLENWPLSQAFEAGLLRGPQLKQHVDAQRQFVEEIDHLKNRQLAELMPSLALSWLNLARMYRVLGETSECKQAVDRANLRSEQAVRYFPGVPQLKIVREQARKIQGLCGRTRGSSDVY